ncbi:hypothetical protein HMPREF0307_00506 [Corynebacterium sp. DNF00584]|nr:hypothetical protein HMPREF0307_00506 [Corynebacterium sp. DNF00584]
MTYGPARAKRRHQGRMAALYVVTVNGGDGLRPACRPGCQVPRSGPSTGARGSANSGATGGGYRRGTRGCPCLPI